MKIYFENDTMKVGKTFFGPWTVINKLTDERHIAEPHISNRFSDVVRIAKRGGFDLKRDPHAIGTVFSWLIAVTTLPSWDPDRMAALTADDNSTLHALYAIYDQLMIATRGTTF